MSHFMNYSLTQVIPEEIRSARPDLVEFLEAYFEWLQQPGNPGEILGELTVYRDLDRTADAFLEYLQREIAVSIPENIRSDKRKLYKNVVDIYLSKGSTPSYQALFNLVFNDDIELFFPRVDILKPSDGKWDAANQRWTNDDGKLSVKKYIQDSRYYQSFSYVIKTGQTIDFWRDSVKKLLHPAGFAFFGQITIFSSATGKMPLLQPGRLEALEAPVPVIGPVVRVPVSIESEIDLNFELISRPTYANGPTWLHIDQYKFVNTQPIADYANYQLSEAVSGAKTSISVVSQIDIITIP